MKRSNNMLRLIYFLFGLVAAICMANILVVAIGKYHIRSLKSLENYVQNVSSVTETITAHRGTIYEAGGEVVAQDQKTYNIICYISPKRQGNGKTPAYITDPLYTSQVLSTILDMDQSDIYYYLTSNPDLFQTELGIKGRGLSEEVKDQILNYPNLYGIGFKESTKRVYPMNGEISPYIVGFAQADENGKLIGKMGIEATFNEELSGTDGYHIYQQDKRGYVLDGMYEENVPARNGNDIYLTIDSSIQQALNTAFKDIVEENNAKKAWGAVLEIKSGKVLAWGQTPSFDPNVLDIEEYNDYGSSLPYEPGSVMKSVIYAAAMDMGVYNGTATFDSSPYCYSSNGGTPYRTYSGDNYGCIYNAGSKSWGTIDLDHGLIYSSNVATSTLLSDYVGVEKFSEYVDAFGFFKEVDTDGVYEMTGYRTYRYPSEKLALTYGQGSSVTMLQLLQAYTAIFGNGEMVKPYFVDHIVDGDTGDVIYQGQRTVVGAPIKESTAKSMQDLLRRVVSDPSGTAKFYGVEEVEIMAKTGTSELVANGGYLSDDSMSSVMLAMPYDDPQYIVYFAYVSPYDYLNHTYSSPIQNLIRRVALLLNVGYDTSENEISTIITEAEMPQLINGDSIKAEEKLEELGVEVVRIGSGSRVIRQYPAAKETIYTGEKVFLYCGGDGVALADLKGFSRKEVQIYGELLELNVFYSGSGLVYDQSLEPYTVVYPGESITVYLKDIRKE